MKLLHCYSNLPSLRDSCMSIGGSESRGGGDVLSQAGRLLSTVSTFLGISA